MKRRLIGEGYCRHCLLSTDFDFVVSFLVLAVLVIFRPAKISKIPPKIFICMHFLLRRLLLWFSVCGIVVYYLVEVQWCAYHIVEC